MYDGAGRTPEDGKAEMGFTAPGMSTNKVFAPDPYSHNAASHELAELNSSRNAHAVELQG